MNKQSVRIGVDKVYAALITADVAGGLTYGTPFALPGVSQIGIARNSSILTHYADDGPSELINQDGDTALTVNLAGLDAETKADLLGESYDSSNGLYKEGWGNTTPYFALGYRSKKANGYYMYFWFYKGKLAKPDASFQTKSGSVTPQENVYVYTAVEPTYEVSAGYNLFKMYVSDDDNAPTGLTDALLASADTGWFSTPLYTPVAPGTPISDLAAVTGTGGAGTVDFTFSAPTGATSVKMQIETPGGNWEDISTDAALSAASTSASVSGLTAGNTENFRLVVVGGASNGISNEDDAAVAAA